MRRRRWLPSDARCGLGSINGIDAVSEDYILIGGGLLIAIVIMHGLWLAWRTRRDPLPLDLSKEVAARTFDAEQLGSDFPNGGARVVGGEGAEQSVPTQRPLVLEGSAPVPVLMDVVEEDAARVDAAAETAVGLPDANDSWPEGKPIVARANDSIVPTRGAGGSFGEQPTREREAPRQEPRQEPRQDKPRERQNEANAVRDSGEKEILAINVLARGNGAIPRRRTSGRHSSAMD